MLSLQQYVPGSDMFHGVVRSLQLQRLLLVGFVNKAFCGRYRYKNSG